MKLGDKVTFSRYYVRSGEYIDHDRMTPEQDAELEENDQIVVNRLTPVDLDRPRTGIVVGKRNMVLRNILGYGEYRFNPESTVFGLLDSEYVDVYLVAVNMGGFYRVPAEWIEIS